jgi:4-amino-4-deoxy-L-arabinose transferase-like glycosyltransferase
VQTRVTVAAPLLQTHRVRRALESWWLFALGLVLAGRLRWAHVSSLARTPFFSTLPGDSAAWDAWAQRVAAGDWLGGPGPYFVDPLYPTLLGALYRLAGRDLWLVREAQVLLSVMTCALVGLLAWRLGGALARNVGVLLYAQLRPDLFNTAEVDKTTLGLALTTGALLLALQPTTRRRALAGVLFGLAILTRGNLALAALVPPVAYALQRRPRHAAASLAGVLLAVAPVTARNLAVSGEWVLTTTGLGANLYLGNNPGAGSGGYDALPFVRPDAQFEEADFHLAAERRVGHGLTATETSAYWRDEALGFVVAHPGLTLRRLALKTWLVLNDFELGDVVELDALSRFAPVLALPLPGAGVIFPLALLGLLTTRRRRDAKLLGAFCAVLAASIVAFFVLARFRAFLLPPATALAAAGLAWAAERLRARSWPALGKGALLVGAAAVVCLWPPPPKRLSAALGPLNLAGVLASQGQLPLAHRLLDEAHQADPAAAAPLCALARVELQQAELSTARAHARACLDLPPAPPGAWAVLAAIELADHRPTEARTALLKQLELTPGDEAARTQLEQLP